MNYLKKICILPVSALLLASCSGAESPGYETSFCYWKTTITFSPSEREMWKQSGGKIDVFADFVGTGGTFGGYAGYLKMANPNIRCYAVEPYGMGFYKDEIIEGTRHGIQGGGYAKEMPNSEKSFVDGAITVTDEEAVEMTHLLAKMEGIFAGFSSGANLAAAIKLLQNEETGKNIGIVINDCGLKYMSTTLWT